MRLPCGSSSTALRSRPKSRSYNCPLHLPCIPTDFRWRSWLTACSASTVCSLSEQDHVALPELSQSRRLRSLAGLLSQRPPPTPSPVFALAMSHSQKHVLFVLTSADKLPLSTSNLHQSSVRSSLLVISLTVSPLLSPPAGAQTGWFLPELAHPYYIFSEAGFKLTVASPHGGAAPLNPASVTNVRTQPPSPSLHPTRFRSRRR